MKTKLLSLLTVALMLSCAGTEPDATVADEANEATESSEGASGAAEDMQMDLISAIVTKGGAMSQDQVAIESMMESMTSIAMDDEARSVVLGHWVGMFGKNKINISLTSMDGTQAEGFSVCAGNFRKITGKVEEQGSGMYHFTLDEPGADQYDGTFDFVVNTAKKELSGSWEPFKKEGNSAKTYKLNKRDFVYDPKVGKYSASEFPLDLSVVENTSTEELGYMRNEVYARHGYSFKNKEWRAVFDKEDCYMPMGVDIRHKLTDLEIKNIGLIYEYETYFDEYYDDYGR